MRKVKYGNFVFETKYKRATIIKEESHSYIDDGESTWKRIERRNGSIKRIQLNHIKDL